MQNKFPEKLEARLMKRNEEGSFRTLYQVHNLIDFSSNDYLGFSKSTSIANNVKAALKKEPPSNGSTGSRLLTGNFDYHTHLEKDLAVFFKSESAILYNSGYDANIGLFSCLGQKGDIILYDELCHASIRDGIRLSHAKAFSFRHNDLRALQKKFNQVKKDSTGSIYTVVESIYSMDGDAAPLLEMSKFCNENNMYFIVDEAHATGVVGNDGKGLVHQLDLSHNIFAAIYTFGKAFGSHGAVITGSNKLKSYLINFSRSFIYTTAMPLHQVLGIKFALQEIQGSTEIKKLINNIQYFRQQVAKRNLQQYFIESKSAIQSCILSDSQRVKTIAKQFVHHGYDVKPILSPTVPLGKERLRFCIHSYNTKDQIDEILELLTTFVGNFKRDNE